MSAVLGPHRRRAAALMSAVAILLVVAAFAGLFLSVHATHVSTVENEINRLRAQAAAVAATQLTLWKLNYDTTQKANVARVVHEHDTSFATTPLFQIDGTLARAAFHVDLWPGEDCVRLKTTANAGGVYCTRWAQMPLALAGGAEPNFSAGFTSQGLQFNGGAAVVGTRLRLTDNHSDQMRSTYWNQKVDVRTFRTQFSFQFTNPNADGFTFVIQNKGLNAVANSGGGSSLGYEGITPSVAVKFDIYGDGTESNSTGLYTNGARPTTPYTAITGGASLRSGHVFDVDLRYDGLTLNLTLTDHSTGVSFTKGYQVNIPGTVGGNEAYVGFTGATGALTATQEILTWTYNSSSQ
jgi:hypothetical protein